MPFDPSIQLATKWLSVCLSVAEYEMSVKCRSVTTGQSESRVSVGTQTNSNGCLGSTNIEFVINSWDKDIQL